jgi:hypothetical protein
MRLTRLTRFTLITRFEVRPVVAVLAAGLADLAARFLGVIFFSATPFTSVRSITAESHS